MSRSLQEVKREVAALVRFMAQEDRNTLVKSMICKFLEEEIDRVIERRQNRCLRCVHLRFFDKSGTGHRGLPLRDNLVQTIGCEMTEQRRGAPCQRFSEQVMPAPFQTYLSEVTVLYELRERFDAIREIWEDYLTR